MSRLTKLARRTMQASRLRSTSRCLAVSLALSTVAVGCSGADTGKPSSSARSGGPASSVSSTSSSTSPVVATSVSSTTSTIPPTTVPPTVSFSGSVAFLYQVWFVDIPDEVEGTPTYVPPAPGSGCLAEGGYEDLAPGTKVLLTDDVGAPVATAELSAGVTVHQVLDTESERSERNRLIDSVFDLRSALVMDDPVAPAEVEVARAHQHLADAGQPSSAPFEGYPFAAAWCRLTFRVEGAPVSARYGVTITHRGTQMFSREVAEGGGMNLVIG